MTAKREPKLEKSWPASKIEIWPIEEIKYYNKNPRTHPPAQLELIASSMKENGVTMPVLVDDDGVLIAGHGRVQAARMNGFGAFPVVVARGWSEERKKAVRLQDNASALLSGWDNELVAGEIAFLQGAGYNLSLLGFGEAQLVQFTTTPGPPSQFPTVGENIATEFECPKCSYKWSGAPKPKANGKPPAKKNGKAGKKK
jgi:hypothetical protein